MSAEGFRPTALLVNLSIPTTSETRLLEAIQNSLSWDSGEENVNLKTVYLYLRAPTEAILYINNSYVDKLVSQALVTLSGPLKASFSFAATMNTEVINLSFNVDSSKVIEQVLRVARDVSGSSVSVYARKDGALLKLNSPLIAVAVNAATETVNGVIQSKNVVIGDHFVLDCCFRCSSLSLREVVNRLEKTGQSLTSFIQHCVCLWDEPPLIIAVREAFYSNSNPPSGGDTTNNRTDIIIICCTAKDAMILTSRAVIELSASMNMNILVLNQSSQSGCDYENVTYNECSTISQADHSLSGVNMYSNTNYLPTMRDYVILWDIDSCPLQSAEFSKSSGTLLSSYDDDVSIILSNIHVTLSEHMTFVHNEQLAPPISKVLFLPNDADNALKPSTSQLNDLREQQFQLVSFSKRAGLDLAMRAEVDALAAKDQYSDHKPTVCLMVGTKDAAQLVISSTMASLRLLGFQVVLIFHNSSIGNNSKEVDLSMILNVATVPWNDVRLLHTYSIEQRRMVLQTFTRLSSNLEFVSEDTCSSSTSTAHSLKPVPHSVTTSSTVSDITTNSTNVTKVPPQLIPKCAQLTIDLLKFSIATHFRNLVQWREQQSDELGNRTTLLFGEDSKGGLEDYCALTFDIDSKIKRQNLSISGPAADIVQKRVSRIQSMLKQAARVRKVHKLLGWSAEHREAVMGSSPIVALQQKLKATVVIHITDSLILAEIVALNSSAHQELLKALEGIRLCDDTWIISQTCIREYKDKHWNSFRSKYAVKIDRGVRAQSKYNGTVPAGMTIVRVWGFGNLLEHAYLGLTGTAAAIAARPFNEVEALLASDTKVIDAGETTGGGDVSGVVASLSDVASGTGADSVAATIETLLPPTIPLPLVSKIYSFQNKDHFTYFTSFQKQYGAYIEKTFGVVLQPVENLGEPNQHQNQSNSAAREQHTVVDMRGTSLALSLAIQYLDKLQASLSKKLTFLPRAVCEKYKALLEVKSIHEVSLRKTRESVLSSSSDAEVVNPMEQEGLLSIRLRPPVHSRGIKRMTFPADTTVTICGVIQTQAQRDTLHTMEQQYVALNSEMAFAELQLPPKSAYGRRLGVRSHREDFVANHELTGLRWEYVEGEAVGKVKLWASNVEILQKVIDFLCEDSEVTVLILREEDGSADQISPLSGTSSTSPNSPGKGVTASTQGDKKESAEAFIHWPQAAFRYLFLSDNLKKGLNELLQNLRQQGGDRLRITCPHRDKRDATVCMLLEGLTTEVLSAETQIVNYLSSINERLETVALICSPYQVQTLLGDDLSRVKKIQGIAGVHLIIDHSANELSNIASRHEMRLLRPRAEENHDVDLVVTSLPTGIRSSSHEAATSSTHIQDVQVSIAFTNAASPGWTWGVSCLLVILESDADMGLSMDDVLELNRGNVLVTTDAFSGKTILRVRLMQALVMSTSMNLWNGVENTSIASSITSSIKNMSETNRLCDAIQRGLMQADRLNIPGLAVVTPIGLLSLSNLSEDNIRVTVIDAVTSYVMKSQIYTLTRIVCLEFLQKPCPELKSAVTPFCNSKLVSTLLAVTESTPRAHLLGCSVPLPAESRYAIKNTHLGSSGTAAANADEKEKVILLRGLDDGLYLAIQDIKDLLVEKGAHGFSPGLE